MKIKKIDSVEEKQKICQEIVDQLPNWFDEQGRRDYVAGVGGTAVWANYIDEKLTGFISIKSNNDFTFEIYVFGVLDKYQRNGIGSELLNTACDYARTSGAKLLAVKTLDAAANYESYDRTRNFYLKNGFLPIDVYTKIWNEENPCLLMVKVL